jgi:23S rRNA (guanosine2251-2'-O)-methyltransferase
MSKSNKQDTHLIYGINGSLAVLEKDQYDIISIDIMQKSPVTKNRELLNLLSKYEPLIKRIPHELFKNRYAQKHTQGIAIKFKGELTKDLPQLNNIQGNYGLLMIDNITDPQNFGQIIRSVECAGINGIIIPDRNSVGITDTVMQVSQGAFSNIDIYSVPNLNQTLSQLKDDDFWAVALENGINAKNWDEIDYSGKIVIVVGSEGEGIKKLVLNSCDFQATIPMQGDTNSLNVSASVAVIAFERLRQIL